MKKSFICLTIIFTLLFSISAFAYDRTTIGSISAGDGTTLFYHDVWDFSYENIPASKNELLVVRFTTTEYYGNKESTHYLFYGSSLLPNETYPDTAIEIDYNVYSLVESAGVLGLSSNIRTTINPNVSVGVEDTKWNAMFRTDLVQQGHYFYDSSNTQYDLTNLVCDYYIDLGSKSFNEGMNYASTLKATNYSALASHYVKGQIFDSNTNTFVKNVQYDLPTPENVRAEDDSLINPFNELSVPFYLLWDNPDSLSELEFYTDIHTEIKYKDYFRVRKNITPWNSVDLETPWLIHSYNPISISRIKYTGDELWDNHKTLQTQLIDDALGTTDAAGTFISMKLPDFMIRYAYVDESGTAHYSNYVLVQCHGDGITTKEVDGKTIDDSLDESDNNITVDKIIEDDTLQNPETNIEINVDDDITSFKGTLKDFVNGLGDFPTLFNSIFGFLPKFIVSLIALVIAIIIIMRILGR